MDTIINKIDTVNQDYVVKRFCEKGVGVVFLRYFLMSWKQIWDRRSLSSLTIG